MEQIKRAYRPIRAEMQERLIMRGAYIQYLKSKGSRKTNAVEQACALVKEQAEVRLARIANGAHPDYKNGKTLILDGVAQ